MSLDRTPFEIVREKLEEHGCKPHGSERHVDALCPAHEDHNPSLSVTDGTTKVLITCHHGCSYDDVLQALNLDRAEVRTQDVQREQYDPVIATYDYTDEQGTLLFQVLRTQAKKFRQRKPEGGGWNWSLAGVRRVPYRLPKIIEAVTVGKIIYVAEGEKDVHSLEAKSCTATCNPGGAGKWRDEYGAYFSGAQVVVIQDNDPVGRAHAATVARSLEVAGASVEIAHSRAGKDATDHLAAGWTIEELELVTPDLAPDLHEFLAQADPGYEWVIEDVLERGDRMIVTGPEGHGKSLFNRTLGICAAAGIHPFTQRFIPKKRVLSIDCENAERQTRRHWRRMATVVETSQVPVPSGGIRLIHRPAGLDLSRDDASWLVEQVVNHKPDVLVIGPLYRLHTKDVNEEIAARQVVTALDTARLSIGCALILEAHSPHGESGRNRPLRPAGSSLFLRWPEFGFGLRPWDLENGRLADPAAWEQQHVARIEQWRGGREERKLPRYVRWGHPEVELPWLPAIPPRRDD